MTARPKSINAPERMWGAIATVEPYRRRDHSESEPFGDSVNVAAKLSVWAPNRKGNAHDGETGFRLAPSLAQFTGRDLAPI